jgi:hypothetical protein
MSFVVWFKSSECSSSLSMAWNQMVTLMHCYEEIVFYILLQQRFFF